MAITTIVRRVQTLEERNTTLAARPAPADAVPFETPADVVAVIAEQANAVRTDPLADPAERARTLGMLAAVALRAIHDKDVTARLEAVERVLKLRKDVEREKQKGGR